MTPRDEIIARQELVEFVSILARPCEPGAARDPIAIDLKRYCHSAGPEAEVPCCRLSCGNRDRI